MSMLDELDLSVIQDERAREGIIGLLNLVAELSQTIQALQSENQRLKDEINRLKGEQGQPPIKPNRPAGPTNYSCEKERQTTQPRKRRRKRDSIHIDREVILDVDPAILPPDAVFKGDDDVVVEDLLVQTDNVLFRKAVFYSAAEGKTYMAALPPGYEGSYGPGCKALALALYFGGQMSGPKILDFFASAGLEMSAGLLSNWLVKDQEVFHAEKDAVFEAGLRSSAWQHIDDTVTRVDGHNQYCHIICNPLYTAYLTPPQQGPPDDG